MSVEHTDRIDAISETPDSKIQLTISDHLDWSDEDAHTSLLQDKIEAYLEFIETGQLAENYPDVLDKKIVISVQMKFPPSEEGLFILNRIDAFFRDKEVDFEWNVIEAEL